MEFRRMYYEKKHADETAIVSKYDYRLIKALINAKLDKKEEDEILQRLDDTLEYKETQRIFFSTVLFAIGILLGVVLGLLTNMPAF